MDRKHLESLIEEGLSTYKIAERVGKCKSTVIYWIKKYNLEDKYKTTKGERKWNMSGENICAECGVIITVENGYQRKNRNRFHSYCKDCISLRDSRKRLDFKNAALNYKGSSCTKCGYIKNVKALEFHHVDPSKKEIQPSRLSNKPWEYARQELDKCVVLCANCHREEHHRLDNNKKLSNDFESNFTSSFSDKILTGKNTGERSCLTCDVVLTEDNMAVGPHKVRCKSCYSKRIIEKTVEAKQRAVDYMGGCCSVCGYDKCIRAIEFHHLDPSLKTEDCHKRFKNWGFERQKKELENCIIVCANCHREIHSADGHQMPLTEPGS